MTVKLINIYTEEVIGEVLTNHSMTDDEVIECLGGEYLNEDDERYSLEGDNLIIKGNRYYGEDLTTKWD